MLREVQKSLVLLFKHGADLYLEDRQKDVDGGLITKGRHYTIQNQLKWFLKIVGHKTRFQNMKETQSLIFVEREMR